MCIIPLDSPSFIILVSRQVCVLTPYFKIYKDVFNGMQQLSRCGDTALREFIIIILMRSFQVAN